MSIHVFFKKVSFAGEILVLLQTSFETTDINFQYFFMVFGANESWGVVLSGFRIIMSNAPLVQILGAGKCAFFSEKWLFKKKIKKWRIYARIESDHFFDFIFEKSDLFYIYDDLGSRWYLSKRILKAILQKNPKAPGMYRIITIEKKRVSDTDQHFI